MLRSRPRPHSGPFPRPAAHLALRCLTLDAVTGYGQHACHTVRQLQARGYRVDVLPGRVWDEHRPVPADVRRCLRQTSTAPWELIIAPPMNGAQERPAVHFSMWESGRLSPGSVAALNRARGVIVPCRWNQEVFDSGGVTVPLQRVPMGMDPSVFCRQPWPSGPITFGAGGRLAHGGVRKGVLQVAAAFLAAFPDRADVRLELKVHQDCEIAEAPRDPRITYLRETWTEAEMAEWYARLHCYVTMATSEGFGFMPLQAMACGRPVIATIAHGHAEYMTPESVLAVPHRLERAEELAGPRWSYAGYWYPPDDAAVAEAMRQVYADPEGARVVGRIAAEQARGFTWERYGSELVETLKGWGVLC